MKFSEEFLQTENPYILIQAVSIKKTGFTVLGLIVSFKYFSILIKNEKKKNSA